MSSAEILSILSIWILFRSFANPIGSLMLSTNNGTRWLIWNISTIILLSGCIMILIPYGNTGLSISLNIVSIFLYIPLWYFLIKPSTNMTFYSYINATLKPLLIAFAALLPLLIFQAFFELNFLASLILFSIFYLLLSKLFNEEIFNYFISFISIEKSS